MNRLRWKPILLVMTFIFFSFFAHVSLASASGAIAVGISPGEDRAVFSSKNFPISLTAGNGLTLSFRSEVQVVATSQGIIKAGTKDLKLPVTIKSPGIMVWNKRPYRGFFRLVPDGKGFSVVNVINIEDYLKGVLKMEVNPLWPMESLKAQAIIARTYALRSRNKHGSSGYDLCATDHCQVYRGINAEDPKTTSAVDSTKGIVLMHQGAYAATFYHADSGGHTANVATVWGSSIPYLQGRPEPLNYVSPYSNWRISMKISDIQRVLASKGINVGKLLSIEILSSDSAGRTETIRLNGSDGRIDIRSSQFRAYLGTDRIKSTMFSVQGKGAPEKSGAFTVSSKFSASEELANLTPQDEQLLVSLTQNGVFNAEELMDMIVRPERRGFHLRNALARQSGCENNKEHGTDLLPPSGDSLTFSGKGWGHGVGMSQWGAKSLAEAGWDYGRILQHYFPGTTLQKTSP